MPVQEEIILDLSNQICHSFNIERNNLKESDNLFHLGVDSMFMMKTVNQLRRYGIKVTLKKLYAKPSLSGIRTLLSENQKSPQNHSTNTEEKLPNMRDGVPFPMTPVQHAYYVGRDENQVLGGNACHLYQEFDGINLNPQTLEAAIFILIERHPMLSVAFQSDGSQKWLTSPVWKGVTTRDLSLLSSKQQFLTLEKLRTTLSHRVLKVESGETFDIQYSKLDKGKHRVHINIDLLIMDASSFSLFFNQLTTLLNGKCLPNQSSNYDFCSYLAQENHELSQQRNSAQAFWKKQWNSLPPAPALPLATEPAQLKKPNFVRRSHTLNKAQWCQLQQTSAEYEVTPTMVLATLYSAALSRWSGQSNLLLNLTLFDCSLLNNQVDKMLADFTNILLLDIKSDQSSFAEQIQRNQHRFADIYEHRSISGVEVLRDLKRNGTHPHGAPVVFTSNLNGSLFGDVTNSPLGVPNWGISQTPQVWIDFVAFRHGESIILQWDAIDALFPSGLLDSLFSAFSCLVDKSIASNFSWNDSLSDLLPTEQSAIREQVNATELPIPQGLLHERIFAPEIHNSNQLAIISESHTMTYDQLSDHARRLASLLIFNQIKLGEHVAICMGKGPGQVVAALAVLYAGGVYVPVAPNQPLSRREIIFTNADIRLVLCCEEEYSQHLWSKAGTHLFWQDRTHSPQINQVVVDPKHPAYVIYTSGSTGVPKGVVISHQAALNTCMDINARHSITSKDRVLGLSALHFDLSVYDIFGVLSVGGAIVIPKESQLRDPMSWDTLVSQHHVTIWNTVPALFDMYLTYCEGMALTSPNHIRTVMLSGDWINLTLPERYRLFSPSGTLSAMGGATEASIWSNEFLVTDINPNWRSIPYGFPLTNQCYRIVDSLGRDCPDWVAGELWIGGIGVALGYCNDATRTAEQFIDLSTTHAAPHNTNLWYRTGDLGCYWPNGSIEFLGRKDNQVKVGGYRIELGEIDAALHQIAGIKTAATLATSIGDGRERQLESFVVAAPKHTKHNRNINSTIAYTTLFEFIDIDHEPAKIADQVAGFITAHLLRYTPHIHHAKVGLSLQEWALAYGLEPSFNPLLETWLIFLHQQHFAVIHYVDTEPNYQILVLPSANVETDNLYSGDQEHTQLMLILTGKEPAHTLLNTSLSPESMLFHSASQQKCSEQITTALSKVSSQSGHTLNIIEVDARSGMNAKRLMTAIDNTNYIAIEPSLSLVQTANKRFSGTHSIAMQDTYPWSSSLIASADIIILNNSLHRANEPKKYLSEVKQLAKEHAIIILIEMSEPSPLGLISANVLSPQTQNLLPPHAIETLLKTDKLLVRGKIGDQQIWVIQDSEQKTQLDPTIIKQALYDQLPAYMIPRRIHLINSMPLSLNGKIDRNSLMSMVTTPENTPSPTKRSHKQASTFSVKETALIGIWQSLFQIKKIDLESDFFHLGGDSLMATRCMGELTKQGYQASLTHLFAQPKLTNFAQSLTRTNTADMENLLKIVTLTDEQYHPFSLTQVQQAYWIGRQPGFILSGVNSQFVIEFRVPYLDITRLNNAMDKIIQRHPMLRAVIQNHQQQVLEHVPPFSLTVHNLLNIEGPKADSLRDELSHQVSNPEQWPLFGIHALTDGQQATRLLVRLDNILLDGLSMQLFLYELETRYLQPDKTWTPLSITFRDYVVAEHAGLMDQNKKFASQDYWQKRIRQLPPAPSLPIQKAPEAVTKNTFIRVSDKISQQDWQALKSIAAEHQLTPSCILMGAYAATLAAWSDQTSVTLNITLFDRKAVHPQINQVLGDFTSLLLLAWQPYLTWLSSAKAMQVQLSQDLQHRDVSAVWVMRELAKHQQTSSATMPVVFTSALGTGSGDFLSEKSWLKPVWGISQTPQVWLDHQVYEADNQLCFNWDAVEELLPKSILEPMFKQYTQVLTTLAQQVEIWHQPLSKLIATPNNVKRIFLASSNKTVTSVEVISRQHSAISREICQCFTRVTQLPISDHEHFFDAGASSLQLVQLHGVLSDLDKSLSVTDLFTYSSPAALALHLTGTSAFLHKTDELLQRRQRQNKRKQDRSRHDS